MSDRYTYRVTWSEEDAEYVGLCLEFPLLSWLAPRPEDAFAGIRQVVEEAMRDMQSAGEAVPEPLSTRPYSGRILLRVPPEMHRELVTQAAEEGVSLNRLLNARLS
ncbi:MAG: toxin-antitoxin system HicB family antitoxin [Chloroflexi bacterium]|nr:toxin-antitoxin system HicB family antitoxin [Chloroflexota bacterium]